MNIIPIGAAAQEIPVMNAQPEPMAPVAPCGCAGGTFISQFLGNKTKAEKFLTTIQILAAIITIIVGLRILIHHKK